MEIIFLTIFLIVAIGGSLIFSIYIGVMNDRCKYRIKKVTVGTKDEYYVQKHFLFFWYTCQEEYYPGDYEEICFDTLEEAKKYIEKRKEKIDKKTEYIYY